jgi:hypothetical protein
MRLGLEKASLWGENLVVLQADVRKAFDSMDHEILIRCLESYRTPVRLIHAILQELSETEMCLHLGQVLGLVSVLLVSAGKQGSSETPSLWNRMLDTALGRARILCLQAGLGAHFKETGREDFVLSHLFWADDVYLFASSLSDARRMFGIYSTCIHELQLEWKLDSLKVLDNWGEHEHAFTQEWDCCFGPLPMQNVVIMVALGVGIDRRGSVECAMDHRLQCFNILWASARPRFCDRRVPLTLRVSRWYSTLARTALFMAGGWAPRDTVLNKITALEKRCLREMIGRHKGEQETNEGFYRRMDGVIHAVQARVRILPLAVQVCCLYFGWAGHLARLPEDRAITKMVRWHALDNFRHSQILGVDSDGAPRRRMARSGKPTRWENVLEKCVGPQWLLDGASRGAWASKKVARAIGAWESIVNRPRGFWSEWHEIPHISKSLGTTFRGSGFGWALPLICIADNMQVCCQMNGTWSAPADKFFQSTVSHGRWLQHCLEAKAKISRWPDFPLPWLHRPRTQNGIADSLANLAVDVGFECWHTSFIIKRSDRLALCIDGASRGNPGVGGAGCVLMIYCANGSVVPVAAVSVPLGDCVTSVQAEFSAAALGYHLIMEWISLMGNRGTGEVQTCLLAGAQSELIVNLLRRCDFRIPDNDEGGRAPV